MSHSSSFLGTKLLRSGVRCAPIRAFSSILLPAARFRAESHGKDATALKGTGKGGRVTKADVLAQLEQLPNLLPTTTAAVTSIAPPAPPPPLAIAPPTAAPVMPPPLSLPFISDPTIPFHDIPNNKMRKIIASRLTASKRDVPHFYVSMDVALDPMLALRKQWKDQNNVKVSINDLILKATALALKEVPAVNSGSSTVDISVAVSTPTGLITPIVFGADRLSLAEIASTMADLAARARDGRLQPHEYQGGSFSLSNLGSYGLAEFAAVINPPQAAILAVGGGIREDTGGATMLTGRLSADRRVVDEVTAARFLQLWRLYMERPEWMLL